LGRIAVPKAVKNMAFGKLGFLPENEGLWEREWITKLLILIIFYHSNDYSNKIVRINN
jgi:hypothetical protein